MTQSKDNSSGSMGRKSHKAQDEHKKQHMQDLKDQIPDQPTRPYVDPDKATNSSNPDRQD